MRHLRRHLDGELRRSCVTPVSEAVGKAITTIEGLATDPANPLLRGWIAAQVPGADTVDLA